MFRLGKKFLSRDPPPGIARNCYGYTAGGLPLAFTQEDFLVFRCFGWSWENVFDLNLYQAKSGVMSFKVVSWGEQRQTSPWLRAWYLLVATVTECIRWCLLLKCPSGEKWLIIYCGLVALTLTSPFSLSNLSQAFGLVNYKNSTICL